MAFAQREAEQQIPPKHNNQGTTKFAQPVNVTINSFLLDINQMVPQVFQHELKFIGEKEITKKDGTLERKTQDLAIGPNNSVSKETRRRLIWKLYQQLLSQHSRFFLKSKHRFTFDGAYMLYSTNQLELKEGEHREFEVDMDAVKLEKRCLDYIPGIKSVTAFLTFTGVLTLRGADAAVNRGDQSTIQFLELLSSQDIYEQNKHFPFGNRMFEERSAIKLEGDPRILKQGLQKNVRFVGDSKDTHQPIFQIDPKKSAFQPPIKLHDFVSQFFNMNAQQLERDMPRLHERARKQVKGLVLVTTHLGNRQVQFSAHDLTVKSAYELEFDKEGHQVRVSDYFQAKYSIRLSHPKLPCIVHRKPGRQGQNQPNDSFYPMEVLNIMPGQRVPIDKQTPKLTEQMIRQCQVMPAHLPGQIQQQRDVVMGQDKENNPFFKRHGLVMDKKLMQAEAQVLFPPAIEYQSGDRVEPDPKGNLEWRSIGRGVPNMRAFIEPAEWPARWVVVIVQNSVRTQDCQYFCEQLVKLAKNRGMRDAELPARVDHYEDTSHEYVRKKFDFYRQNNCKFVLCFATGKRNAHDGDIHKVLKKCEQEFGVITQHISPEIMQKGISSGGGAMMVLENILMKTNLKLGGVNFDLVTPRVYKKASRIEADIFSNVWLNSKRMFIGIDFSHAPASSLYDRQAGKAPSIPSIVGMAYTIDKKMLRMRGTYWCQQTRQATITEAHQRPFIDELKDALVNYMTNNGAYPEHLIVFRAGISESEFKRIAFWEGQAFCKAFEELAAKEQNVKFHAPAVTIIVCSRRSNYRMIPSNINPQAKAADQNVQPGTVLDKGVMSASRTEFLLISHRALQGTAQPMLFSVVHEWRPQSGPASRIPAQLPLEELENIANTLAYSHGICTMPTAMPGVLYAAGELAKRGRNNYKVHAGDGHNMPQLDLPPTEEKEADQAAIELAKLQMDKQRAVHNAEMSRLLKPTLPTKFWA